MSARRRAVTAAGLAALLGLALDRRRRRDGELGDYVARVKVLSDERGRLVGQAVGAEERERALLSQALHDDILQTLIVVEQDLAEAADGSAEALASARRALGAAIHGLREMAFQLHPLLMERKGLEVALDAIGRASGALGGFETTVIIEKGAVGVDDRLVLSLARELLMNAAKHADARNVTVRLATGGGSVELLVVDDGVGISRDRLERALGEGHFGLAMLAERVRALGGTFSIDPAGDGRGTEIRARIPAARPAPTEPSPLLR